MPYSVIFSKRAERQLDGLSRDVQQRLVSRIETLGNDPRPHGVVKMAGEENAWRIRVGTYRILYAIHDAASEVVISTIAHRREAYRR